VAVWALSGVHLSFADAKPMHMAGENWRRHWEKIERAWRASAGPEDVVLVSGDITSRAASATRRTLPI
jgi:predicted phosphohydrolase